MVLLRKMCFYELNHVFFSRCTVHNVYTVRHTFSFMQNYNNNSTKKPLIKDKSQFLLSQLAADEFLQQQCVFQHPDIFYCFLHCSFITLNKHTLWFIFVSTPNKSYYCQEQYNSLCKFLTNPQFPAKVTSC